MPRNTAETVFTGDAAGLLSAYQQVREENRKREQELRELKATARDAHQEEVKGLREAQQMYREVQTPLEKYRDRVKDIERAYESGSIDQETYNRQLAHQKGLLDQTSASTNLAATAVKSLASAFMGFVGIQAILAAIRAEIDNLRARGANAASTQLSVAQAERAALKNFGAERGSDLLGMAQRVQKATGADYVSVLNTISQASSQLGTGLGDKELEDAVTVAARLSPGTPEEIQQGAGAIISQMKVTGGTAAQIAGQQMAAKKLSPVVSDAAFAANIVPGANNLMKLGLTQEQAYGLMASAGSATDDSTGQTTANAMTNFMVQLKTLAPQFANPFEALDFVRSDEGGKLRRKLLGPLERDQRQAEQEAAASGQVGLTGEKKFLPYLVELLQPQVNAAQQSLSQSVRGIPSLAAAGPQLERDLAAINALPNQQTADLQRRLAAANQSAELANVEEGRASISREGMLKLLQAQGVSAAGQKFAAAKFDISTGFGTQGNAIDFMESEFESRARSLREVQSVSAGIGAPGTVRGPSRENLEEARAFDALAAELQRIREAIDHQTGEMLMLDSKTPVTAPEAAQGR